MVIRHLRSDTPSTGESFHQLASLGTARIEHIVSSEAPETSAQRQAWDEWVLVLAGSAVLEVEDSSVDVGVGDWLLLPAGTSHRVVQAESGTQWLAVHAGGPDRQP